MTSSPSFTGPIILVVAGSLLSIAGIASHWRDAAPSNTQENAADAAVISATVKDIQKNCNGTLTVSVRVSGNNTSYMDVTCTEAVKNAAK